MQAAYDFSCPQCGYLRFKGLLVQGSWIETKCNRCDHVFHYGPRGTHDTGWDLRCPVCRRLFLRGQIAEGSWFETRCNSCTGYLWFCNSPTPVIPFGGKEVIREDKSWRDPIRIGGQYDKGNTVQIRRITE